MSADNADGIVALQCTKEDLLVHFKQSQLSTSCENTTQRDIEGERAGFGWSLDTILGPKENVFLF